MGECHCELELLWPKYIHHELRRFREQRQWLDYPKRVRDWKGKMADLFDGTPPGSVILEL